MSPDDAHDNCHRRRRRRRRHHHDNDDDDNDNDDNDDDDDPIADVRHRRRMSEEEEEEEKEEEEQEEEEQEEEEPGKPFKLDEVWEKSFSPAGNRTPVSRVTGEDTHHYTTEDDALSLILCQSVVKIKWSDVYMRKKLFPCGESNPGRGGESAES
jgi:hypothetical protein